VTGRSRGSGTSYDYATIKYNALGIEQWVARYGTGGSYAKAIVVDNSGNVYVTGESEEDYVTIKYNANGDTVWIRGFNGPAHDDDFVSAIAVDGVGNVYVAGSCYDWEENSDYVTVKYDANGVEQWVAVYNSPGYYEDYAHAMVVDGSGNVYVTGGSYGPGTSSDYLTIKYNTNGDTIWARRYDGPAIEYNDDEARAIAVDGSGNVYVTGSSGGSGTYYDYATIKYNSLGQEQWVVRYNGPGNRGDFADAIAVDGFGNVYVTGYSYGSGTDYDYATIKYSSAGVEQWVQRYNGLENGYDEARAIAADVSGNVYVTGYSYSSGTSGDYATIKYNSAGVQQWVQRYGMGYSYARAITVDGFGNVYVTGYSSSYDYVTIKYNSNGIERWVARYDGSGSGSGYATAIAVDNWENVYVTGRSNDDYATVKYNTNGVEEWVARYNGPGNLTDVANALAVDGFGNVYVAGESDNDYATIKYSSNGIEQWVASYNGPGIEHNNDVACAIAADGSGNIYVTGCSYGSRTDYDYVTIKYVQIWNRYADIPTLILNKGVKDGGALVAVESTLFAFRGNKSNEFYKYSMLPDTWTVMESIPFGYKLGTTKINKKKIGKGASLCYDSDSIIYATKGNGTKEFWAYNINNNSWTAKAFVTVPKALKGGTSIAYLDGKIYLLAGGHKPTDPTNFYCYNTSTNEWTQATAVLFGSTYKPWKDGSCITEMDGKIYALKGGDKVQYFCAYDTTTQTWTTDSIPEGDSLYGKWKKVKVKDGGAMTSGEGAIYAIKGGGANVFWKYSTTEGWTRLELIPRLHKKSVPKTGASLAYANGQVYLLKGNNTPEFWCYTPSTAYSKEQIAKSNLVGQGFSLANIYPFMLYQNSPNPFNSQTAIRYSIPRECNVSLSIYDISGKLVKTLINETMNVGVYTLSWNGNDNDGRKVGQGVYFYILKTAGEEMQKKMLMLK
jgi:uncharacterized delta-60 repeat protein